MIGFWVLGTVIIASAIWTVTAKKPVYSVVGLLCKLCRAGRAVPYALRRVPGGHADHRLLGRDPGAVRVRDRAALQRRRAVRAGAQPLAEDRGAGHRARRSSGSASWRTRSARSALSRAAFPVSGSNLGPVGNADVFGSVADFGKALFTVQLLPFEVTAFILMVAVIGVVLLAGDQAPYVPTRKRAGQVERSMREAILRGRRSASRCSFPYRTTSRSRR